MSNQKFNRQFYHNSKVRSFQFFYKFDRTECRTTEPAFISNDYGVCLLVLFNTLSFY